MAGATGIEPATSAVTGQRSNRLSYAPAKGRQKVGDDFGGVNDFAPTFDELFSVIDEPS
jgi:hypothetical protein